MSSVLDQAVSRYAAGESIPQIADDLGLGRGMLRYRLYKAGVLRSRSDGVRRAAEEGRLGSGLRGKTREFSKEHCANISRGRMRWADAGNAIGVSLKPNGYVEFTRGPHKGRSVHVVMMEERLGRALREDECVHHIDGDKTNNTDSNLALVTRSGHQRLHRREQRIAKGLE
jgi:hypothetical protein